MFASVACRCHSVSVPKDGVRKGVPCTGVLFPVVRHELSSGISKSKSEDVVQVVQLWCARQQIRIEVAVVVGSDAVFRYPPVNENDDLSRGSVERRLVQHIL